MISIRFVLAASLTLTVPTGAQERLYAIEGGGAFTRLLHLDPGTGAESSRVPIPGINYEFRTLVRFGDRLLAIDTVTPPGSPPDRLVSIHPADGRVVHIGLTGEDWLPSHVSLELDRTSGTLYASEGLTLFQVSPSTGQATVVGPITGLQPGGCICSIAISAQGTAFALASSQVYQLDLNSAAALWLGNLPPGSPTFWDLSFSSNDVLWGVASSSPTSPAGLYTIDALSLTATLVQPLPFPHVAIAFGPDCSSMTYCTAKTNSQGCLPTISTRGLASPTATLGFEIEGTNVLNQSFGALFYGVQGRAQTPFAGGTFCLATPTSRTAGLVHAGGSSLPASDCSGTWTVDFNTLMQTAGLGLAPGTTVNAQWMGRDRGFPRANAISLTDAVEFLLCP